MKIISGFLKGRNIKGYDIEGTRPTMDRVRESLFAMIQNYLPNSTALDLFSGCATLGLEAISNGSKLCYFNDINKKCISNIQKNIQEFKINDKAIISNLNYKKALKMYKEQQITFDIIFLDPPYHMDCINEIIEFILDNKLLNKEGLIICEIDHKYLKEYNNINLIKEKKYGNKYIFIYQKQEEEK